MECCCGQAAMVHADHVNLWCKVELLIPLLNGPSTHLIDVRNCVKNVR